MDRATVYNGEELIETDILNGNKFAMIGLAKLAQAVLGTAPVLQGLACTPGTGLTAAIAAGQVYQMAAVDATPYSSLGADARQVLKQGILADPIAVPVPAPGTAGKSINYLVQVQFQEVDTGALVLPFYNASNPAIPYSGPGGLGTSSMTIRSGKCAVQVKAGAMANTGSQVMPAADAGWVGAYSVQVDYGMSTVPAQNIALVPGAPFLTLALPQAAPLNSPAFTGTPTVPTPTPGDSSQKVVNSAFVSAAVSNSAAALLTTISNNSKGQYSDMYFYGQL